MTAHGQNPLSLDTASRAVPGAPTRPPPGSASPSDPRSDVVRIGREPSLLSIPPEPLPMRAAAPPARPSPARSGAQDAEPGRCPPSSTADLLVPTRATESPAPFHVKHEVWSDRPLETVGAQGQRDACRRRPDRGGLRAGRPGMPSLCHAHPPRRGRGDRFDAATGGRNLCPVTGLPLHRACPPPLRRPGDRDLLTSAADATVVLDSCREGPGAALPPTARSALPGPDSDQSRDTRAWEVH